MTFENYFEGIFENELQAKSGSQWSWIVIQHNKVEDGMFEVIHSYKFEEDNPYKKSFVKFTYGDNKVISKVYDHETLQYKEGCDIIFVPRDDGSYHGKTTCHECFIPYEGKKTFLISDVKFGPDYYHSLDIGVDVETNEILWGSKYGHLKFTRLCSSAG